MQSLFRLSLSWAVKAKFHSGIINIAGRVKRQYRLLSMRFHPDRHGGLSTSSSHNQYKLAFQALNEARELVSKKHEIKL